MSRFAVVVFLAGFFLLTGQVAQAQPDKDQYYRIKCVHSKLVFGVNGLKDAGTNVLQLPISSNDGQLWKFVKVGDYYNVANRLSGKCLNVKDGSKAEDAEIIQWDAEDNSGENQQWSLEKKGDHYVMKARHSGLVLSVESGSKKPHAKLTQHSYEKGDNQHFDLVPVNAARRGGKVYFPKDDKEFKIKEADVLRFGYSSPGSPGYSIATEVTTGKATITERTIYQVEKGTAVAPPGSGAIEFEVKPVPGQLGKVTFTVTVMSPGGKSDVRRYKFEVVK